MPEPDFYSQMTLSASALQRWYNPSGLWDTTGWWNAANCLEAIERVAAVNNGQTQMGVLATTFERNSTNDFLNEYYDDEGWWALAWIRAFDLTGEKRYLDMAKLIFQNMTGGWDDHCEGGIWWRKQKRYKNAIANELFLLVAIRLHQRTPADAGAASYLDWAQREWAWFKSTGMLNPTNLVNDGLGRDCQNNGRTTWSYNQGVLMGGLTELYKTTGDEALLSQAIAIADTTIRILVDQNGTFAEPTEKRGLHGGDVPQFKGIFIRHLAELYDVTGRSTYRQFLVRNAETIWSQDRDELNRFGGRWSGPIDSVDAARQSSAMRVFSALAAPVTTNLFFVRGAGSANFSHSLGGPAGSIGWSAEPQGTSEPGMLASSPEIESLPAGLHSLHVRLAVNRVSRSSAPIAELQVVGQSKGKKMARRLIKWREFKNPDQAQDFDLKFRNQAGAPVQFVLNSLGTTGSPVLTATDFTVDGFHNWMAANLAHEVGRLDSVENWAANPLQDKASGYMTKGPATTELGGGDYDACFELKVDNFNEDASLLATLSVVDATTQAALASRDIQRTDFHNVLYHSFHVRFKTSPGQPLEFRTFWHYAPHAPRLTERAIVVRRVEKQT